MNIKIPLSNRTGVPMFATVYYREGRWYANYSDLDFGTGRRSWSTPTLPVWFLSGIWKRVQQHWVVLRQECCLEMDYVCSLRAKALCRKLYVSQTNSIRFIITLLRFTDFTFCWDSTDSFTNVKIFATRMLFLERNKNIEIDRVYVVRIIPLHRQL